MPAAFYNPHPFLDLCFRSTSPLTRIRIALPKRTQRHPTDTTEPDTPPDNPAPSHPANADPLAEYTGRSALRMVVKAKGVGSVKDETVRRLREAVWMERE